MLSLASFLSSCKFSCAVVNGFPVVINPLDSESIAMAVQRREMLTFRIYWYECGRR